MTRKENVIIGRIAVRVLYQISSITLVNIELGEDSLQTLSLGQCHEFHRG